MSVVQRTLLSSLVKYTGVMPKSTNHQTVRKISMSRKQDLSEASLESPDASSIDVDQASGVERASESPEKPPCESRIGLTVDADGNVSDGPLGPKGPSQPAKRPPRPRRTRKKLTDQEKAMVTLDKLEQVFSRYDYPITVAFVASKLEVPKGAVNSFISSHRKLFDRYECQPPLWRLSLPANGSS